MQQLIIRTSAWTLFFAFTIFSYGLAVFGLIFPGVMAGLGDSLGAANMAGMYYERVYNARKTPENAYTVLERYITAQNHKKVVEYGAKFLEPREYEGVYQDNYKDIIETVNKEGYKAAAGDRINLLKWGNEDNRVKSAYMVALLNAGPMGPARFRLYGWLAESPDLEQPNHAFFAFVIAGKETAEDVTIFGNYVDNFDGAFDFASFDGEPIFAVDFLWTAYSYLQGPNSGKALHYAELFYDLI